MNYTNDQLDAYFDELPEIIQDFIMNEGTQSTIQQITNNYSVKDTDGLQRAILALLIGKNSLEDFTKSLLDLGLDQTAASHLTTSLNDEVLDTLYTIAREEEGSETAEQEKPITPAPQPGTPPTNLPMMPEEHEIAIRKIDTASINNSQAPAAVPTAPKAQPTQPISQIQPPIKKVANIMDTRLGTSINLPRQEINIGQTPKAQPAPQAKKSDPYREPIE